MWVVVLVNVDVYILARLWDPPAMSNRLSLNSFAIDGTHHLVLLFSYKQETNEVLHISEGRFMQPHTHQGPCMGHGLMANIWARGHFPFMGHVKLAIYGQYMAHVGSKFLWPM